MRGWPENNFPAFSEAVRELESRGFRMTSPHQMDLDLGFNPSDIPSEEFIKECILRDLEAISQSEAIVFLPGWQESEGAMAEYHVAKWMGKPCLLYPSLRPVSEAGEKFGTGSQRDSREGKGRFDLLPPYAIKRLAQHFENGAKKYDDRNWELGQPVSRYLDSGLRHAFAYLENKADEDHLTAAAWNLLCAIETEHRVKEELLPLELLDMPNLNLVAK